MIIRSSVFGIDEMFCAIQGYTGACIINAIRGTSVFAPISAAVFFGGVTLIEKLFYQLSKNIIPGLTGFWGPIPIGTKNIVSHGLAIYTTLKIMELVGLILNVPQAVTIIGLSCAAALVVSGFKALVEYKMKTFDERLQDHLNSNFFSNEVFCFRHENKDYNIRVICNPKKKTVVFQPKGFGKISCNDAYILACNDSIPKAFSERFELLFKNHSTFSARINCAYPLDYTAYPMFD